jgi:hypothetical protein
LHEKLKSCIANDKWGSIHEFLSNSLSYAEQIEAIKVSEEGLTNRDIMREHALDLAASVDAMTQRINHYKQKAVDAAAGLSWIRNTGHQGGGHWNYPQKLTDLQRARSMLKSAEDPQEWLVKAYNDVQRRYPTRIPDRHFVKSDPLQGVPEEPVPR